MRRVPSGAISTTLEVAGIALIALAVLLFNPILGLGAVGAALLLIGFLIGPDL